MPGDRFPLWVGVGLDRSFHSSDAQAGRPAVLILGGALPPAMLAPLLDAFAARRTEFAAEGADLLLLLGFSALGHLHRGGGTGGVTPLLCPDDVFAAFEAPFAAPPVVVIDRAGRIAACWQTSTADARRAEPLAAEAVGVVGRLGRAPARHGVPPAPVLTVPGLFDASLCRDLIAGFEASETFDSGVSGSGLNGADADRVDHGRKCRRDWLLEPGDGVFEHVVGLLVRRCVPEIKRAFQHEVSHVDRILVARYDAGIGLFKRHRDNVGASVAFRQFALSVNLNAGDYDGGALLFPEFNDHQYRPDTGEGLVFSSSLLHEATRVLSGRRYVLLTFLHDAEAEARRLARLAQVALAA